MHVERRDELQELVDKQEIRDVLARYARGVDRDDWALVRDCFTADATDDHGVVKGSVDNLVVEAREILHPFCGITHNLCQSYIEVDGDEASAETYALTTRRRSSPDGPGEVATFSGLRYVDRLRKVGGRWRIAERVTTMEWTTTVSGSEWTPPGVFTVGRRDRSDISYSFGLP